MERRRRLWLGLGAAVLVGGENVAAAPAPATGIAVDSGAARPDALLLAQASEVAQGGEGGPNEGGGQVLGTITEFRLANTDPNAYRYDAAPQVAAYAALVHERYATAAAAAVKMQEAIAALLAAPGEATLAAARDAWRAGYGAYLPTEAFLFYAGPVDAEGGPIKRLAAWPVNPGFLDYTAGAPNGGLINDTAIALNRGAIVRMDQASGAADVTTGWHAIEFLLWGEDLSATGPGARPAGDFVAGIGNNDRRRDYLGIVTQLLVNDLTAVAAQWAPDANNYRAAILAMDQRNAIGRAFTGMAVLAGYEVGLKRIGASLRQTGREYEPSRFSDNTSADIAADLRGIRDVYLGAATGFAGSGFDRLVAGIDPALNDRVLAALAGAGQAVAALDQPYDSILASPRGSAERGRAEAAMAAMKELSIALRAAGNRLGVLVLVPGV